MKTLEIVCSNCGKKQKIKCTRTGMLSKIEDVVDKGWGSCGSALYCPECTKTWADRNGNRPMSGKNNTIYRIWDMATDVMMQHEE